MPVHAFVFPGQGSQTIGMGRDSGRRLRRGPRSVRRSGRNPEAEAFKAYVRGPHETLTLTENAQPALMAMSLAVLRVMETEGGFALRQKAVLVAGHSLGEYSALSAAGSFAIPDAARLLRLRGQAMQQAVPTGEGAMAALIGVQLADVQAICDEAAPVPDSRTGQREVIEPANDNGGGQIVISGHRGAVERAAEIARAIRNGPASRQGRSPGGRLFRSTVRAP